MSILKRQLLIILMIYVGESSGLIDALYNTGQKVWEFYSTLEKSILISAFNPRTVGELFGDDHGTNKKIRDRMYEIHMDLHEIGRSIDLEIMNNLNRIMKSRVLVVKCLDLMRIYIDNIEWSIMNIIILNDLITSIFPNIESNIEMIRKIITDPKELLPNEQSLITAINGHTLTRSNEICNSLQSINEMLVRLFEIALIAEIKTSLMSSIANIQRYNEDEVWKVMNTYGRMQFQKYFQTYVSIMQRNLELSMGQSIRACDPEDGAWILNENYYEMDGFKQTILFQYQPASCPFKFCRNIWQKRSTLCDAKYYDTRSSCSSTPVDCEDFGVVQACLLKNGPYKYQYVNSTKLGFMGNNITCPENNGYIIGNLNGSHSGYATCGCSCHSNHNKISIVLMNSTKISDKTVIIGLRFKRKNNILHIQPRIGELMAHGCIKRNSEKWLRIPDYVDESEIHSVDEENNLFFLDDLLLPPKFVLTGVKFIKAKRGILTGFGIEIFGVPFDYRSGRLNLGMEFRLAASKSNPRQRSLFSLSDPLQSKLPNIPNSSNMKYIQLEQSLLRTNFGQSILPLFDAVPIITHPSSILGGIGIFHKSAKGYAGFISLRIYGIKYSQYFTDFALAHSVDGQVQLFN